jgi:uncharacterized protein (DUF983 family)
MPTNLPMPRTAVALKRGFFCRCPHCGEGKLFKSYLKLVDQCEICGERLGHIRADDMPAYLTIAIVGHIVVGLMLTAIQMGVPNWLGISVSMGLTIGMTLWLLPHMKGVVAAQLWRLKIPKGSIEAQG